MTRANRRPRRPTIRTTLLAVALSTTALLGAEPFEFALWPDGAVPDSEVDAWVAGELDAQKQYFSRHWQTEVVTNVSRPSLVVHLPEPSKATGAAVVIAPGGGFHALSIETEGNQLARWLTGRGVAAMVLKYRLVPSEDDAIAELMAKPRDQVLDHFSKVRPLAIADTRQAVRAVREQAEPWQLDPDRVALIGFSAGGAASLGTIDGEESERPDLLALIYPGADREGERELPDELPPLFLTTAANDPLGLARPTLDLCSAWLERGQTPELHLYSNGGHGFGTRTQGLPSDSWFERYGDWLELNGWFAAKSAD